MKLSTPIIALTATATKTVRRTVVESLAMRNYGVIEESPERSNVKYVVQKVFSKRWDEIFEWLCREVKDKQISTERIIIYCHSRKHVGELYAYFCSMLPHELHKYFNMYHTNTEDGVQREIIESFSKEDGEVRVLFATIAFGLGIDVRAVHTVFLLGHSTDLDDFMQLSGRAGRDGSQSVAVIIEHPGAGSGLKTSEEMKEFLRGEVCRRKVIRESFPSKPSNVSILKHNCCDICAKTCTCDVNICSFVPSFAEQQLHDIAIHGTSTSEHQVVTVSDTEVNQLTAKLEQFRETLLIPSTSHMYSGGDMSCGLSLSTIKDITSQCHFVFNFDQFCERYLFSTKVISLQVWEILQTTLNRQSEPSVVIEYSSDESVEDSEDDLLNDEHAEVVMDADSSDSD